MFIASLLRNAAARLFPRLNRSSTAVEISTGTQSPPLHPILQTTSPRTQWPVDRIEAGSTILPIQKIQSTARPKRRPFQPHPTLWAVRSGDAWQKVYCGPTAVAAAIGADVDKVIHIIQWQRGNYHSVTGTDIGDLQQVLGHFGYDLQLVADLRCKSPTLARWERELTDWEFEKPLLVIVTGHWTRNIGGVS